VSPSRRERRGREAITLIACRLRLAVECRHDRTPVGEPVPVCVFLDDTGLNEFAEDTGVDRNVRELPCPVALIGRYHRAEVVLKTGTVGEEGLSRSPEIVHVTDWS